MSLKLIVFVTAELFVVTTTLSLPNKLIHGRPFNGLVPRPPQSFTEKSLATSGISSGHFEQKLDHFNSTDTRTWSQLYHINNNEYKTGGPIFIMISGEAPAEISWMTYGQWYKNAKYYNALMFQLEHRFYGSSHPTQDTSIENLKYLTSSQALADLDDFINAMMLKFNTSKVILFGGAYAGNLAAWYTASYSSAIGAIASSAPVTAEDDFNRYLEAVGDDMNYFVYGCYDNVQQAFASVLSLVQNQDTDSIMNQFPLCTSTLNFNDSYEIDTFFKSMITLWMEAAQYAPPEKTSSTQLYSMCTIMGDSYYGSTPLIRLSYLYMHMQSCIDTDYLTEVEQLTETDWSAGPVVSGSRQWTWQKCNEFGYFQTTDSVNQPFGQVVSLEYMENTTCTMIFGQTIAQIESNTAATNADYGGANGSEENVFFINGSLDPWHYLSVFQFAPDITDFVGYIPGTSHCYDMGNDLPTDPAQLTAVRNQITKQIELWLTADNAQLS